MDPIAFVALVSLISMIGILAFGVADYNKTAWCFGLISSLLYILLPILVASDAEKLIVMLSGIFQPNVASGVARMMLNLLFIGGVVGLITCIVMGFRWLWLESKKESQRIEQRAREISSDIASNIPEQESGAVIRHDKDHL